MAVSPAQSTTAPWALNEAFACQVLNSRHGPLQAPAMTLTLDLF